MCGVCYFADSSHPSGSTSWVENSAYSNSGWVGAFAKYTVSKIVLLFCFRYKLVKRSKN